MPSVRNWIQRFIAAAVVACCLPPPAYSAEWHVAPDGSPAGGGDRESPWDLATALSGAPAKGAPRIAPGDTVWLHGGTYRGGFESTLSGTAEMPIHVRQAPGERATIDCRPRDERDSGLLYIRGEHAVYQGFEVTCTDPKRATEIAGSWPEDIRRGGVSGRGSHVKFVNLIVHDVGGGVDFWAEAEGGEIYGCLIYFNGWKGPDRGHGHAVYSQNRAGTKQIEENVMFNQFGYGLHCYGSEKAFLEGFHLEGNIAFNNGSLAKPGDRTTSYLVGGGSPVKRLVMKENFSYGGGAQLGYAAGVTSDEAEVKDNYLVGGLRIREFARLSVSGNTVIADNNVVSLETPAGRDASAYSWDDNVYYRTGKQWADLTLGQGKPPRAVEFADWQAAGIDAASSYREEAPAGAKVFVRPNRYEPGRANVVVFNWDESEFVEIDLAGVLRRGQGYRIVSVQDFFGKPVAKGTFDGAAVKLPMRPVPPAQPVGMSDYPLPVIEPAFGAFVVLPDE